MVRDNRHDSAYLFGAICPARAVGAAMITPAANTEAMNLHLGEVSTQVTAGAQALLVCDGAGWHQRGRQLVVPDNIAMLTLPAYSPELNPKENLWDEIREKIFKNLALKSMNAVRAKLREAVLYIERNPEIVKSITAFPHIAKSI